MKMVIQTIVPDVWGEDEVDGPEISLDTGASFNYNVPIVVDGRTYFLSHDDAKLLGEFLIRYSGMHSTD